MVHVIYLRMKAEHYTSSLQPSWLLPTPLWMSIVWHFRQWAQEQLQIQSSLSFNGGAGCKVPHHLHLCRVSLQLYIPPSDVTKHSMQLPSTYELLHCAAPVPVYACLSLCVDIVFWFSFSIFFLHIYIYIHTSVFICIYIYIYVCVYLCVFILYMPISVFVFSIFLARF